MSEEQRLAIWRLLEAYRRASSGRLTLSQIFARIAQTLAEAKDAFILWVDTIETIIHEVEVIYGPKPGLGAYKSVQVKEAIAYIIQKADVRSKGGILAFSDSALELVVDWVIDAIVLLLNRRNLWQLPEGDKTGLARLMQLRLRALALLLNILGFLRRVLADSPTMLPQVRAIANKAAAEKGGNLSQTLHDAVNFFVWFVQNRAQLLGLIEMVATATVEAEAFLELSGPEKQRYARELVILAIEDATGTDLDEPPWREISQAAIDFGIDAVVRIFNKRSLFYHEPAPAIANPAIAA